MITKNQSPINGILLLNKALHASSNRALQQVKRLYQAKKAGHTGSLDPLATGVLPLCFGEATKFSQYLLDADKIYTVWGRLGATTITGDAEGDVCVISNAPKISKTMLEVAIKAFIGDIQQVPPMYSALKKDGVPLYRLAREGKEIERAARAITIYDIQLNEFSDTPETDFQITVHCSKGTYIRTLVEDIGKHLNSGAYLLGLRRDKAGPYCLENSFTLEQLEAISTDSDPNSLQALLLPADTAVAHFPSVSLDKSETVMIQQGKQFYVKSLESTENLENIVRLYHESTFMGLGKLASDGLLRVQRLIGNNV